MGFILKAKENGDKRLLASAARSRMLTGMMIFVASIVTFELRRCTRRVSTHEKNGRFVQRVFPDIPACSSEAEGKERKLTHDKVGDQLDINLFLCDSDSSPVTTVDYQRIVPKVG